MYNWFPNDNNAIAVTLSRTGLARHDPTTDINAARSRYILVYARKYRNNRFEVAVHRSHKCLKLSFVY